MSRRLRPRSLLLFFVALGLAGCGGNLGTPGGSPQRLPDARVHAPRSQSASESILYNFPGGNDGAFPYAGLLEDKDGDLYGTTDGGGGSDDGAVFKLTPGSGGYTETVLYAFSGKPDGALPYSTLVEGKKGVLYGTTYSGGSLGDGCVFALTPSRAGYVESVLYSFSGSAGDGGNPYAGLFIDKKSGVLYGTTLYGGAYGPGAVFSLTPTGNGWSEKVIYSFRGGNDGAVPYAGLIQDKDGTFYGATIEGGPANAGTIYKLTPAGNSYSESVLYAFKGGSGDGAAPYGLLLNKMQALYGTTLDGGTTGNGTVFELKPSGSAYTEKLVYSFQGGNDGSAPHSGLTLTKGGTLYGTTSAGGLYGSGTVFELARSHGAYAESVAYSFEGYPDAGSPFGNLFETKAGTLLGLSFNGGYDGNGTVFQITP